MKLATFILIALLTSGSSLFGQSRILQGRIISTDLEPLPKVQIQNLNEVILAETNLEGRFEIKLPQKNRVLLLSGVGLEQTEIILNDNCDTVEVVMEFAGTYDFMSSSKVDRLRLEEFRKLPELHLQAYKKGLFRRSTVCYLRQFEPDKPTLDSISKEIVKLQKLNKETFKNLNVGDTIKIPFSTQYNSDGTHRTSLIVYSFLAHKFNYDCIIAVEITEKNRRRKGYNLHCKVTSCNLCKSESIYNGRTMKIGEMFEYNMKYFKILTE